MQIKNKAKDILQQKNYTAYSLSKRVGTNPSYLAAFLNREFIRPGTRIGYLVNLAEALDCDLNDLYEIQEQNK